MESPALGQQNGILENQTRMGGLESKCDVREAQKVLKMFEVCLFYFLKDFICGVEGWGEKAYNCN